MHFCAFWCILVHFGGFRGRFGGFERGLVDTGGRIGRFWEGWRWRGGGVLMAMAREGAGRGGGAAGATVGCDAGGVQVQGRRWLW